jgi:hypothetical protein
VNWDAISAMAELLSTVGVFITLIYLAVQIRQNTRSNRVSAELDCLKLLTDWVGRISESKEKQRLYDMGASGTAVMTPEELRQYIWMIGEFGWIAQSAYIQYRRGDLSPEAWKEFERMQVGMLQNEIAKKWWLNREVPYSAEYVGYIENLRESGTGFRLKATTAVLTK